MQGGIAGIWFSFKTQGGTPITQPTDLDCRSASGNLWSNVKLYKDASCSSELAIVVGGKDGQVKLRYPDSSEEWKEWNVATSQYVKADDSEIAVKQWFEPR